MTNLNKGRFKCADEAQAVWNFFVQIYSTFDVNGFKEGDLMAQHRFSSIAKELHKARLIHGSIYDEHGRVEDKDVAQAEYEAALYDIDIFSSTPLCVHGDDPRIYNNFIFCGQNSAAIGTIFYGGKKWFL